MELDGHLQLRRMDASDLRRYGVALCWLYRSWRLAAELNMPYGLAFILLNISVPLVARVLSALGVGLISYVSITKFVDYIVAQITVQVGAISGSALTILTMSGIFQALSIILSALSVKATLLALKKLSFFPATL